MSDYIQPLAQGQQPARQSDEDYLVERMRNQQTQQMREMLANAPAPDDVATSNRLGPQLGMHPASVDGMHADAQRAVRINRMAQVAQQHPTIGAWAAQNPRGAVAASDDHQALSTLGSAWNALTTWANPRPFQASAQDSAAIRREAANVNTQNPVGALFDWLSGSKPGDTGNTFAASAEGTFSTILRGIPYLAHMAASAYAPNAIKPLDGADPLNRLADALATGSQLTQAQVKSRNWATRGAKLLGGVAPFAVAGGAAPILMGTSGAGQEVEAAKKVGKLGTPEADRAILANAAYQAVIGHALGALSPALGSYIAPRLGSLVGDAVTRSVAKVVGNDFAAIAAGDIGERAGMALGDYAARAVGSATLGALMQGGANAIERFTINPNRSLTEGVGDSALSMVALDLVTHGIHAALGGADAAGDPVVTTRQLAETGRTILPDAARAVAGLRDASILDAINKAGADSKFKARDPEGYRDLVGFLSKEAGVDQVYVSPEAIRAYQQSDSYDAFADPFHDYADAIHEAEATGSDVALPVEFVLGDLAGTKAGDAIRDGIRLRADGLTGGEARELADKLPDVARETFDRLSEQDKAAAQESDARAALVERLTGEIQNAGYTPRNAAIMAELVAQRAATRAERLGRTLQPSDFDTRIVRVLPPSLEGMRKADQIDLVINALRKGKPVETQSGKTLLEWIAARGGINDSGGDLRSMGLDRWHLNDKGKRPVPIRGRRPILRDFDPRQSSMGGISGEGDFGHDSTLRAAVEAGYFPELEHVPVGELDTNDLLAAIGDEMAGRPRYAAAPKVDPVRAAAEDLRRMIDAEGRDPSGMTDAEIRKLIDDVSARPVPGGRAFEQPKAPVAKVQGNEIAPLHATIKDLRTNAKEWFTAHLRGTTVHSQALGRDVEFASPKKMLAFSGDAQKMRAIPALPEIIAKGELLSTQAPYNAKADHSTIAYHRIGAAVQIGDVVKHVEVTIREGANGHLYYDHILPENAARNPEAPDYNTGLGETGGALNQVAQSVENFNLRMQGEESGPRGRILLPADGWGSAPATIELFQHANLSTLAHELGHQWLEELRFDAQHPDAPDQLKADWAAAQKWFADHGHPIGDDGVIPTDAHEMWARGIERYLLEGKAPATGIARVFEAILGWMTRIYKSVLDLHSPINPEIRQVFDRLLATDDEIKAQTDALAMHPAITDPKALGMSDAEAKQYRALAERARDNAHGALLEKTMAAIRRQRTAEWQEQRARVRSEEATRLEEGPLFTALRLMKDRPISREWVVDRIGEDAVALLPKRVPPMVEEGGAHPDDIAEMAGFDSGEQMLEVLLGAERAHRAAKEAGDARTLRNRIIDTATDAEMQRRHGDDPLNDGSIEEEAIAAVNNDLAGKLLETELRYLGRTTGRPATAYDAARAWARSKVRQGTVAAEAMAGAVQRYSRAVAKAGRDAEKALIAGDMNAAFEAKQRQQLSAALLSEAKSAHDEVTKAQDRLARIAKRKTMKSVDQDYLDQAHALLDDVDLGPRSQKSIERQGKWAEWAAERRSEGFDVVVPDSFEATLDKRHWTRLPVSDFLALRDTVDQVMHLGKLKQTLLDRQEERTWDSIRQEVNVGADMMRQKKVQTLDQIHGADVVENIKAGLYKWDAMLRNMETIVDMMDGGDPNGVWNRVFFRPLAEAEAKENGMFAVWQKFLHGTFNEIPRKDAGKWLDRIQTPWGRVNFEDGSEIDLGTLSRQRVISMALNWGNEGNRQRLADGYRINRQSIEHFLTSTLSGSEWQFVQKMWDHIDGYKELLFEMERRVNGVRPEAVEAVPFTVVTPDGERIEMRGGYFPAIYDGKINAKAADQDAAREGLRAAGYTNANTQASSTKARAETVKRPILLDLGLLNRHVSEVIHDITHREAIIQAWRFATDPKIYGAVKRTLGPEYADMLKPFVKRVANTWASERVGNEVVGRLINSARSNMTVATLGLNGVTVAVHVTMAAMGGAEIGMKNMWHGLWAITREPVAAVARVKELSHEIRAISDHYDQTLSDKIAEIAYKNAGQMAVSKLRRAAVASRKFAMYGITFIVQRMAAASWIGAHAKAISEGMSETDARAYADKIVRRVSGGHGAKDMPALFDPNGRYTSAIKLLTAFYQPMKALYQRQARFAHDALNLDQRNPRNIPELAARAISMFILPLVAGQAVRMTLGQAGPDKDESWPAFWAKKFAGEMLGPIPVLGSAVEPIWDKVAGHGFHSPNVTPLQRSLDAIVKEASDLGRELRGQTVKKPVQDALQAGGYVTGLVPGQAAKAAQFLTDVGNGTQRPGTLMEWARGLQTGEAKPKR